MTFYRKLLFRKLAIQLAEVLFAKTGRIITVAATWYVDVIGFNREKH